MRKMKKTAKCSVVFLSNLFTIHQTEFSDIMNELTDGNFYFIETVIDEDDEKRKQLQTEGYSYLLQYYDPQQRKRCRSLIDNADIVIFGSASDQLIRNRLKQNKLTFHYSERRFKKKLTLWRYPRALVGEWLHRGRYQKYPLYLLCASAYTAADCHFFGNFVGKAYKWGYFPKLYVHEAEDQFFAKKRKGNILWCARFIKEKHPEIPVKLAKRLKEAGCEFNLCMIGTGELHEKIRAQVKKDGLEDCVHLPGFMPTEKVREFMDQAPIFLFTSDRWEGWGAVLNEAMNSGCAAVASHAIGSAPYLICDGENGCLYQDGNLEDLYRKVCTLLEQPELCEALGRKAYATVLNQWNYRVAAERLLCLGEHLNAGNEGQTPYTEGPCSVAEPLADDWYRPNK